MDVIIMKGNRMNKQVVRNIQLEGKRILLRVDFNVPLDDEGSVADDSRIRAALPTIKHCLQNKASLILISHLGRPKSAEDKRLSLNSVAKKLQDLLNKENLLTGNEVRHCPEVTGETAAQMTKNIEPGQVLVLENLRFDSREKENDEDFAKELAAYADVYVNDAFGSCHRTDASMSAVPKQFSDENKAIGLLIEKELNALRQLLKDPTEPFVVLLGGAKVSDKIGVVKNLIDRADYCLIGGALAYTFLKARGLSVGRSRVETEQLNFARQMLKRGAEKIRLPKDHKITKTDDGSGEIKTVKGSIPADWYGFDIGPDTANEYSDIIDQAETVVWNGPLGMFEREEFRAGTKKVVTAMSRSNATTVAGGGESSAVLDQLGLTDALDHVSTGGGAFLTYLEKGSLPALELIPDKKEKSREETQEPFGESPGQLA